MGTRCYQLVVLRRLLWVAWLRIALHLFLHRGDQGYVLQYQ